MKIDKLIMKDQYLLYARKSSEGEDQQVVSIENQLEVLHRLAEERKLNILSTYTESKSAKAPGREEFNKLIQMIDTRQDIKGIIAWKPNRLFRNPQDEGLVRQRLSDGRILEIVTPSKTYDETDSDFTLAIEGSQGQRFIRDLRIDTKRGVDRKLELGDYPGLAPAGYKNDLEKRQGEKTISPHPLYFKLVKHIFELAITGKFSTKELYRKAIQMGIKTNRGRSISRTQLYNILRNPFYTGRFIYDGVTYQGKHTPMVSDSEFNAVQDALVKKSHPRIQTHTFDFQGSIKCGECGYFWTGETHLKKNGKVYDYYKCCKKGIGCNQPMVAAPELRERISKYLSNLTIKKSYVDWMIKWLREAEVQDRAVRLKQHCVLKADYTNAITKMDNLTEKWLSVENEDKSLLSNEEYKRFKQKYLIENQSIYRRMKNSDQELSEWTDTLIATFNFTISLKNRWDYGTTEDRKNILLVTGSEITIKDKVLSIKPRTPFKYIEKAISNSSFEAKASSPVFMSTVLGG